MNTVVLHPLGFAIEDDFGPEGRRYVQTGEGVLIFHARHNATSYAKLRDLISEEWKANGMMYTDEFVELCDTAKEYAREHGRSFTVSV